MFPGFTKFVHDTKSRFGTLLFSGIQHTTSPTTSVLSPVHRLFGVPSGIFVYYYFHLSLSQRRLLQPGLVSVPETIKPCSPFPGIHLMSRPGGSYHLPLRSVKVNVPKTDL